ncbi:MAG: BREX-1 system adenine-specific DNA-methyltransferase PglX [Ignavibacteriales bacterium]|nr:MAG: BREX-1 system adenine-specific DNA-methyltransferase PglX [Ignavibacteriales bacterium]
MKLSEHAEHIRQLIDRAFRNRLGRMGIHEKNSDQISSIPLQYHRERERMDSIHKVFTAETGTTAEAYEKLVEELTFTLFNRLAALKVMEAHTLHPEIVTRRESHGGRSFAHLAWLEQNPEARSHEAEGLIPFLEEQLNRLAGDIPLFSPAHPYHLLPAPLEMQGIITAYNSIETDPQVEPGIWKSDDILGWLYESYNNYKKAAHKASGQKTEFNKVSIQSQVYTPRWVVQFLVDNSLGKLYLEMYPESKIKDKYKIAGAPASRVREPKPLHELRMIDPANGSGNFLLYGFDLFYDLYLDQIEEYGAPYAIADIPELIITNNLHGIDLDDRAVQLAQLGLYIKAKRKKRSVKIEHFNIVSSDFFLPPYQEVKHLFETNGQIDRWAEKIIIDIWKDLQQAYKFGSLLRLEEKFAGHMSVLVSQFESIQISLYSEATLADYEQFRQNFFSGLQKAVEEHSKKQGLTFLNTKTQDALTFLQIITQKYDVAVANPPYTDSADFGKDLKEFIETNYKKPYKFNSNLYAAFIKRSYELAGDKAKVALVHPPTFMYIKTFEEVRKFIIEKLKIQLFVEWGYLGMFHPSARVDSAMYILDKAKSEKSVQFIKLNDIYEGRRYEAFSQAYNDLLANRPNKHNFTLPQEKLKIIDGWPFIYWISDGFREKFKGKVLGQINKVATGLMTGDNDRFLRFYWEIDKQKISTYYPHDNKKWVPYQKGGPFCRWYGNSWILVNFKNDGADLATTDNKRFYFLEGVTYSASGSKGASFRYIEPKYAFDKGGACIFNTSRSTSTFYLLAFLNSSLASYIVDCLNPTVNIQKGDLERIPFILPPNQLEQIITSIAKENVLFKQKLYSYDLIEVNYLESPLLSFQASTLTHRMIDYLTSNNSLISRVIINEAIINELVFNVYNLSFEDKEQVEAKMGKSVGSLPVFEEARSEFLTQIIDPRPEVVDYIKQLPLASFEENTVREIKEGFETLYQSNNDLEEFCIRHQVNPINVWYWFKEANILPKARAAEIALEFLADSIRTLLQQDDDGIIPLVGLPGEDALSKRLEDYCLQQGFTPAQYMQLDGLLGRTVNEYLEHHFFKDLSNHLNLFMYLPKTPFIWHLSSGPHQGFEVYILIYKWNRDSLFKLKSKYINNRVQNLGYRLAQLAGVNTAQGQQELETIRYQLQEIDMFTKKLDELIAEGYDPKLDDGVGKNIAPLQKKGMLRAEVLKSGGKNSQLEKYLNADW